MARKNFVICVVFSLWTVIQTSAHLVFVIYSYYMSICEKSPSEAPTIFFYLTYLYNKRCDKPVLQKPNNFTLETLESYVFSIVRSIYKETNNDVTLEEMVAKLVEKIDLFPDYAAPSEKTTIFLLSFIILDAAWIISAASLLMGTCFGLKQFLSLIFCGPWLIMTVCVSIFDFAASVTFGLDVSETTSFANWLKFVGIHETSAFEDFDARNPSILPLAPTLALCFISSRFFIIWIINWIGFFFVLKATISAYKDSYKNVHGHRRHFTHSSPIRSQTDLDTSAARIRKWQLFYGAAETSSTQDSKSVSEKDFNSNSKDMEMQPEEMPSISGIVSNVGTFYYAYPDVAENIETCGSNVCLDELRSQLPWSYIPVQGDIRAGRRKSEEGLEMEIMNTRNYRLKSDSSTSGIDS